MSEYWRYRCLTCNKDSECSVNRGDDRLREIAKYQKCFVEISKNTDIGLRCYAAEDAIDFLIEHDGHKLLIVSEYGDTQEI